MILRSIRVEGWRCFAAPVEVGPFVDGLNIIHGPNGIGKSTLMTALVRGLFDSHSVGGGDIKSLRPWGRSLAPKVTIEFEHHGEQFQLHKQFLSSESARLDRKENGDYVPFAESRAGLQPSVVVHARPNIPQAILLRGPPICHDDGHDARHWCDRRDMPHAHLRKQQGWLWDVGGVVGGEQRKRHARESYPRLPQAESPEVDGYSSALHSEACEDELKNLFPSLFSGEEPRENPGADGDDSSSEKGSGAWSAGSGDND